MILFCNVLFKTPDHLQELLITSEPQGMYLGNCYGHSDCIFYDLYNSYCSSLDSCLIILVSDKICVLGCILWPSV